MQKLMLITSLVCVAAVAVALGLWAHKLDTAFLQDRDYTLAYYANQQLLDAENMLAFETKANEVARLEATLNVLAILEEWRDNTSDGECRCRADGIARLYRDNVALTHCCTTVLAAPPRLPCVCPPCRPCSEAAQQRISPLDLLPPGAMEMGGLTPMLNFMSGDTPSAPQVEVPPRPVPAAELRRLKGSAVTP
jgi:hypothetical protein